MLPQPKPVCNNTIYGKYAKYPTTPKYLTPQTLPLKALYFDGSKLNLKTDYPAPTQKSLVKVTLAGICGTDLQILRGYTSFCGVLGHEFVGVVEESEDGELDGMRVVGEINVGCKKCAMCLGGLQRHCPHRRVLGIQNKDGAFAQYLSLPCSNLHKIPDCISDRQAVFVEPLAAAFEIQEQLLLSPQEKIAVLGDGRLAQLIVRVLWLTNKNLVCFGRHPRKLKLVEKLGVPTKTQITDRDQNSFDVVVEATANQAGFEDAIRLVKPRGKIVLKSTVSKSRLDVTPAIINEVTLVGSRCGPFRPAIEALSSGVVSVDELVDKIYSLEQYEAAFADAANSEKLKIMLKP